MHAVFIKICCTMLRIGYCVQTPYSTEWMYLCPELPNDYLRVHPPLGGNVREREENPDTCHIGAGMGTVYGSLHTVLLEIFVPVTQSMPSLGVHSTLDQSWKEDWYFCQVKYLLQVIQTPVEPAVFLHVLVNHFQCGNMVSAHDTSFPYADWLGCGNLPSLKRDSSQFRISN